MSHDLKNQDHWSRSKVKVKIWVGLAKEAVDLSSTLHQKQLLAASCLSRAVNWTLRVVVVVVVVLQQ